MSKGILRNTFLPLNYNYVWHYYGAPQGADLGLTWPFPLPKNLHKKPWRLSFRSGEVGFNYYLFLISATSTAVKMPVNSSWKAVVKLLRPIELPFYRKIWQWREEILHRVLTKTSTQEFFNTLHLASLF